MRINILTEAPGWILRRCVDELANRLPNVTINAAGPADITYYVHYHYAIGRAHDTGVKVGFFTHEENSKFKTAAGLVQGHVAMNQKMVALLASYGARDPIVIRPGVDIWKTPVFGIVGRTYGSGRKNEGFVRKMVEEGYTVKAWGSGWPCSIVGRTPGPRDYINLDYLVITSTNEGGPIPVAEAISMGVPVIAPDVGWCWEFPCIRYERGNWDSLHAVLKGLTARPTWAEWAEAHRVYFAHLLEVAA